MVFEGKSCRGKFEFQNKLSLKNCAIKCRNVSTVFVHAFREEQGRCSSAGCNCFCMLDTTLDGACDTYYDNPSYKIYKYLTKAEVDLETITSSGNTDFCLS